MRIIVCILMINIYGCASNNQLITKTDTQLASLIRTYIMKHQDSVYADKVFFTNEVATINIDIRYTNTRVRSLCYANEDKGKYSISYSKARFNRFKGDIKKLEADVHSAIAYCMYIKHRHGDILHTDVVSN
jgi:hypothetical protein